MESETLAEGIDSLVQFDDEHFAVKLNNFALKDTLECGQTLRWIRLAKERYLVFSADKVVLLYLSDQDVLHIIGASEQELKYWLTYLDYDTDYAAIQKRY
ncbi:MAG: DNA glycosylase [Coriobacteriia bacterium]|nr:DNA glycosylase [Coriobacteriia bacterium]